MSKIRDALARSIVEKDRHKGAPAEKRALGKGLAALIGSQDARIYTRPVPIVKSDTAQDTGAIRYLEINSIVSGKYQPREDFNDQMLKELIGSIKEKGVLQPILVRKVGLGFEIIAGERRYRASQALGLKRIPVIVKDVEDRDALIISLIENIQRQELNPMEEAHAFHQLLDKFSFSQDAIAKALGKNKTTISNILRLLKLPSSIQQLISKGDLTIGHAKVLLGIEEGSRQKKLCQMILANSLSVRELENLINVGSKRRKRRIETQSSVDPYVLDCERQLQHALGTKVRLLTQRKRGKIVIEYYSAEDLERIIKILKK